MLHMFCVTPGLPRGGERGQIYPGPQAPRDLTALNPLRPWKPHKVNQQ